jgi:cytochrome c biogenesis protein CcmG/thiol:disulfide interchange protein DsbE
VKLTYFPLALFLAFSVLLWRGLALDPHQLPSSKLNQPLPQLSMPGLMNNEPLQTSTLHGRVSLLNIWASWCESCQDEQAFLVHLAQTQAINLVGINYKDESHDALAWLRRFGNPYTQIGQDYDGRLSIDLGVYGVPETFLIDAQGIIRYRHAGALTPAIWQREFLPRVHALEAA